jgi:hypothetical protein
MIKRTQNALSSAIEHRGADHRGASHRQPHGSHAKTVPPVLARDALHEGAHAPREAPLNRAVEQDYRLIQPADGFPPDPCSWPEIPIVLAEGLCHGPGRGPRARVAGDAVGRCASLSE